MVKSPAVPLWFAISEKAKEPIMRRISSAVHDLNMHVQVRNAPMLAHWFILDTLTIANRANREGMHANAIALIRQSVEAISIVELGVCRHNLAEAKLLDWEGQRVTAGKLRMWLEAEVWPSYGDGLWSENWTDFMKEFAKAVQGYAHYGPELAQWQLRLHGTYQTGSESGKHAVVEVRPRAYDAQKATRITLFHAIITFVLGRVWSAANPDDKDFEFLIEHVGQSLAESRYLDGAQTRWGEQFWAMMWNSDGSPILE